jgi:hypothetical protein
MYKQKDSLRVILGDFYVCSLLLADLLAIAKKGLNQIG